MSQQSEKHRPIAAVAHTNTDSEGNFQFCIILIYKHILQDQDSLHRLPAKLEAISQGPIHNCNTTNTHTHIYIYINIYHYLCVSIDALLLHA